MTSLKDLIIGSFLYLLGQTVVWYQINGQFISDWIKEHPWLMSLLGVPISYIYILATRYTTDAFGGELWPQRFIGFSMGMLAFAVLTFIHLNEAISLKTGVTLMLSIGIVLIQIFWK